jgi:hypothetical protein
VHGYQHDERNKANCKNAHSIIIGGRAEILH